MCPKLCRLSVGKGNYFIESIRCPEALRMVRRVPICIPIGICVRYCPVLMLLAGLDASLRLSSLPGGCLGCWREGSTAPKPCSLLLSLDPGL